MVQKVQISLAYFCRKICYQEIGKSPKLVTLMLNQSKKNFLVDTTTFDIILTLLKIFGNFWRDNLEFSFLLRRVRSIRCINSDSGHLSGSRSAEQGALRVGLQRMLRGDNPVLGWKGIHGPRSDCSSPEKPFRWCRHQKRCELVWPKVVLGKVAPSAEQTPIRYIIEFVCDVIGKFLFTEGDFRPYGNFCTGCQSWWNFLTVS